MDVKIVKLSGNPAERSKSYAKQLHTRIKQTYDFYNDVVFEHSELSEVEIYKRVNILISKTRAVFPNLISELECISESANIPIQQIFLINARTEILNASVGECTSIAIPKNNLIAQTWDWIEELEKLMVILIVEKEDGSSFVTLTEPGMLAKIGVNSYGIGVGLNFLKSEHSLDGVPVHLLLRAILDCESLKNVREIVAQSNMGKSSYIPVATSTGEAVGFEFSNNVMQELNPVDDVLLHTNHCLAPNLTSIPLPTSNQRYETTLANLRAGLNPDFATVDQILSDTSSSEAPVQAPYKPSESLGNLAVGTCATIIMELEKLRFSYRKGPNPFGPYHSICLNDL
jgi:isopenicillin-N N-acyltransferase-like protein